ncbi:hypothetical protein ACFYOT_23495 [Saccharothrix saharensis]|uniref:hypothetical protein n=1 Tax=Saccharothrix saharensis TaxID=571190 RepID=UPI0036AD7E91
MSESGFVARRVDSALPGRTAPLTEITARTGQAPPFELFRLVVELVVGRDGIVLLSGPVDWREPRERLPDADPARWSGPATLAHSLGPRSCCVRLDDLCRGEGEDFVTVDEHGSVVPPERRAGRSRPLVIRFPQDFPLVIGSPEAVHALVRAAPVPPEVFQARDTAVDYAAYRHLWHGPAPETYFGAETLVEAPDDRKAFVPAYEQGESFGMTHREAALVGDGPAPVALVPLPSDAQCAADIAPLLPTMDRARWLAFRAGYLHRRPDGRGVIDLLEHGDTTGWARAARNGDWALARALVEAQLAADGPVDPRAARACESIGREALTDPPAISADDLVAALAHVPAASVALPKRRWWHH